MRINRDITCVDNVKATNHNSEASYVDTADHDPKTSYDDTYPDQAHYNTYSVRIEDNTVRFIS